MKLKFIWMSAAIIFCLSIIGLVFGQSYNQIVLPLKTPFAKAPFIETPKPASNISIKENTYQQNGFLQDKFQQKFLRLKKFREDGTLEELINEGNEIEKEFENSGGDDYAKLFLEFSNVLTSKRYLDNNVMELSRNFAAQALKKADTFDLEYEWKLLSFLGGFDYPSDKLNDNLIQKRRERVKLWLHAIHRLETEKDNNFSPDDLPQLNIAPPPSTGLPAGVSPEAIRDEKLRNEYEKAIAANTKKVKYYNKQSRLRINENFFVNKIAVNYISTAYSKSPTNLTELDKLLDEYHISENIREMIKSQIQSPK